MILLVRYAATLALLIAVASQSVPSPVGDQTNLTLSGPGPYRFLDITRQGLPLTLTMTVVMPPLICRHVNF